MIIMLLFICSYRFNVTYGEFALNNNLALMCTLLLMMYQKKTQEKNKQCKEPWFDMIFY